MEINLEQMKEYVPQNFYNSVAREHEMNLSLECGNPAINITLMGAKDSDYLSVTAIAMSQGRATICKYVLIDKREDISFTPLTPTMIQWMCNHPS